MMKLRIPRDELFLMCSFCVQLALLIFVLSLVGCGGGSEGTGSAISSRAGTLEGKVSSSTDLPIPGAIVTVAETGERVVTDAEGKFSVEAPADTPSLTLAVTASSATGDVVLENVAVDPSTAANVSIKLDAATHQIRATQVSATARIVGTCDSAFENDRVIRQGNHLDDGISCLAKVVVQSNGKNIGGIRVAVQHRACDITAPWQDSAIGTTNKDVHRGIAQVAFAFYTTPEFCQYRIVVPFNDPRFEPVIFEINTRQQQLLGFEESAADPR
jgi:hypothetical protein